ncbi:hypothetical protein [Thermococcus litoralis]|uniref:hypothetical protein n=1 Tax=Thermococcus litoralis TaxID=2265 RepID=UPI0011D26C9D|nr:hypothetical protein [Thermococcus litoralis]
MKEKTLRRISLLIFIIGVLLLLIEISALLYLRLSLPPWSFETEGKYVAFGLTIVIASLFLSVPISFFLLAYLTHPQELNRFSELKTPILIGLGIGAFVVSLLMIICRDFFNTLSFLSVAFLSILSTKKDKIQKKSNFLLIVWVFLIICIVEVAYFLYFWGLILL